MANNYYDHTTYPQTGAAGSSAAMRSELDAIEAGFDKLPTLGAPEANKLVKVKADGSGLENSAVFSDNGTNGTVSGDLTVSGGNLGPDADSLHTLPNVAADTFTLNAATQTLTNKTLTSPAVNGGTIDGTTIGGTTPAAGTFTSLSDSGNLTFTGTGNRIRGDFSNATTANRVIFQTSTVNGATSVGLIPNGTSAVSNLLLWTGLTGNDSFAQLAMNGGTDARLTSGIAGTGTYLPMTFYTSGTEKLRIAADTTGTYTFGGTAPRITGDFSNATVANRVMFQSSVANSTTSVAALPNGSSNNSNFTVFSNSGPTDAARGQLAATATDIRIVSDAIGAGSVFPLTFWVGASERMRIDTSGNVGIGATNPRAPLAFPGTVGTVGVPGKIRLFDDGASNFYGFGVSTGLLDVVAGTGGGVAFYTNGANERMRIDSSGNVLVTNSAGLGYGTGAGGTVTQTTSKSTAVTLNKPTGQITMNNAALAASGTVGFTFNNSLLTNTDLLMIQVQGGVSSNGSYLVWADNSVLSSGQIQIYLQNRTGGSLSEAVVLKYVIIKGATA